MYIAHEHEMKLTLVGKFKFKFLTWISRNDESEFCCLFTFKNTPYLDLNKNITLFTSFSSLWCEEVFKKCLELVATVETMSTC